MMRQAGLVAGQVLCRLLTGWERHGLVYGPIHGPRYVTDVAWYRVALSSCPGEIPLFALRKAVQIKKACPEAILEVVELMEEQKLIDP